MVIFLRRAVFLLMALVLVPELLASNYNDEPEVGLYGEDVPDAYETNERVIVSNIYVTFYFRIQCFTRNS